MFLKKAQQTCTHLQRDVFAGLQRCVKENAWRIFSLLRGLLPALAAMKNAFMQPRAYCKAAKNHPVASTEWSENPKI